MEECKNLEYEKALENEDYAKILNSVCKKYRFRMDKEDLHRCKLIALWDAIKKFNPDKGVKFTSFLYNCITWECRRQVTQNNKRKTVPLINEKQQQISSHYELTDLINSLPKEYSKVLIQKFFHGYTITEIAKQNNYSRETARIRVNNAIDKLRRKCE